MMLRMSAVVSMMAGVALAQAPKPAAVVIEKAPLVKAGFKLACPAGTAQVGGPAMEGYYCFRSGSDGQRVFHGPLVALRRDGSVEATGQSENGMRSGKWVFFDAAGLKVGETEFKGGNFHGRRAFFSANGQPKSEEFWVEGKRQGPQKSWDEAGNLTVVNYLDDKPSAN